MPDGVQKVTSWLRECADLFHDRIDELDHLDRELGDGDHGTNMDRGLSAAQSLNLDGEMTAADALRHVGMALVGNVGGSSGPLFGTFFLRVGANWPRPVATPGVANALEAGLSGVMARGKAERGDKTMVDALAPAVDALQEAARTRVPLGDALTRAAEAAEKGRDATLTMIAKRGRASLRAEQSIGLLDPGAVSMALILRTAVNHVA